MQQHDVMLPIRSPLFTTTTDQLIGSVPAAANPTIANWYYANALELVVSSGAVGIRNSGWRANPYLLTVEPEPSDDPTRAVLYLLRSGFYVAFCGLSAGDCPSAGLICGASGERFQVLFSVPDGTVRILWIPFPVLTRDLPRVLRGIKARSTAVPFDATAISAALLRYFRSPERAVLSSCALSTRAQRLLREHRAVVLCAMKTLGGGRMEGEGHCLGMVRWKCQ